GQHRFGPEAESRLQGVYEDGDEDDPAAPARRGPSNRRQRVAAVAIVLVLAVLAIYGANLFEWVSAIMNPHQDPCNPVNVTLDDILGPSYPAQSLNDSRYWTGPQAGGVPHKRALSPPCTITNAEGEVVPTFVQVTGVYLRNYSIALYDCSDHFKYVNGGGPYPTHQIFCDNVGDILAMATVEGRVAVFREALIFVPNVVRISAARTTSDSATRSSGT